MLSNRLLMRTIAGGHKVPWPEPLTDNGYVFPKDYRMNDFPRTPEGGNWYDIPDEGYFSWLADYLPNNLPKFTPEQQKIADNLDTYRRLNGFWIGDRGGWYDNVAASHPKYEFPDNFADVGDLTVVAVRDGGFTYDEYVDSYQDLIGDDERLMTQEEFLLDDFGWHLALEEEKRLFSQYWPDFRKMDGFNVVFMNFSVYDEPPDAGWRVYLGMVLRRIENKAYRIKELKDFYHYWREMVSK